MNLLYIYKQYIHLILELAKNTWGNPSLQKLTSQPQMYSEIWKKNQETQENEPVCKETGGIVVNEIVWHNKHTHTHIHTQTVRDRNGKEIAAKGRSGLQNSFKIGNKVSQRTRNHRQTDLNLRNFIDHN